MQPLKQKMSKQLIIIISLTILILPSGFLTFVYLEKNPTISTILVIFAFILVILLLNIRNKFEYTKHEYHLVGLIENKEKPFKLSKPILNKDFYDYITKKLNYSHHHSDSTYTMYYKVDKGLSKKKNQTLFGIIVIHKNISFTDNITNNAFESLEKYLHKKIKYRQRIFYQFKDIKKSIDKNMQTDADHIFFINDRRNNLMLLNLVYNSLNNDIYYLHSKSFRPNNFINKPADYLDELIKYKIKSEIS